MQRRFKINVEGHEYVVVVEEITDESSGLYPDRGTMRAVPAEPIQPGGLSPSSATNTETPPPSIGPGDVVSPLAGVVVSIDVELGQKVAANTRVITLEAMKTKTMVAAGRAGKVSTIGVRIGQGVEAGQALLTIA